MFFRSCQHLLKTLDKVLSFRTLNDDKNADTFHHTSELFIEKLDPGRQRRGGGCCLLYLVASNCKTCKVHMLHILPWILLHPLHRHFASVSQRCVGCSARGTWSKKSLWAFGLKGILSLEWTRIWQDSISQTQVCVHGIDLSKNSGFLLRNHKVNGFSFPTYVVCEHGSLAMLGNHGNFHYLSKRFNIKICQNLLESKTTLL